MLAAARFATTRGAAIADLREAAMPFRVAFFAPAAAFGPPVFLEARDALPMERRPREGLVDFAITMSHARVFGPDKARPAWPRNPPLGE